MMAATQTLSVTAQRLLLRCSTSDNAEKGFVASHQLLRAVFAGLFC
jgi:hypothetical protein